MMRIAFSSVVDRQRKFQRQALTWVETLLETQTADPDEVFVHLIGDQPVLARALDRKGVRAVRVESGFTGPAVYCNKLLQLEPRRYEGFDTVVLCDTDVAFAENIRADLEAQTRVSAKTVDAPNPPVAILETLIAARGIRAKPRLIRLPLTGDPMIETNCNGGFYVIPARELEPLAGRWKQHAGWALEQGAILERYLHHSDQIGFCLAALDLDLAFEQLPLRFNFPLHFQLPTYDSLEPVTPAVLHYHWLLDERRFVERIGIPWIDAAVDRVNSMLERCRHTADAFDFD